MWKPLTLREGQPFAQKVPLVSFHSGLVIILLLLCLLLSCLNIRITWTELRLLFLRVNVGIIAAEAN